MDHSPRQMESWKWTDRAANICRTTVEAACNLPFLPQRLQRARRGLPDPGALQMDAGLINSSSPQRLPLASTAFRMLALQLESAANVRCGLQTEAAAQTAQQPRA